MNELNTILEKIQTFNINANTNIDIQKIVETYMMFDAVKILSVSIIEWLVIIIIAVMIFKLIKRGIETTERKIELKKMEEILENFDSWKEIENLNERLKDIQRYIPRKKTPIKID